MAIGERAETSEERALGGRIDAGAWGLLFVWVGVALLAQVGWAAGLVGAGAITLGAQALRRVLGVRVDRFGLCVGALFAVSGIWNLLDLRLDLVPLLFIAAGVFLLASTWRAGRRTGRTGVDAPAHPRA